MGSGVEVGSALGDATGMGVGEGVGIDEAVAKGEGTADGRAVTVEVASGVGGAEFGAPVVAFCASGVVEAWLGNKVDTGVGLATDGMGV